MVRVALDLQDPAVGFHDAPAHGQTQARAVAALGRVERLEDARQVLRRNAAAVVLDQHLHGALRPRPRGDPDGAAIAVDGVSGIEQQVHGHLLDLVRVRLDRGQFLGQIQGQIHLVQGQLGHHHGHGPPHHLVEVHGLAGGRGGPGEIQQAPDDPAAPDRLAHDHVQVVAGVLVAIQPLAEQGGIAQHAGQRVVDLMGHAGRQPPHGGQLVRLGQLALGLGQALGHGVEGAGQLA